SRGAHYLSVVARLKREVTVVRADVEMKTIAERLARQHQDTSPGESAGVLLLQDQVVGPIRPALLPLVAAVGFVWLIGCWYVANLLLVRASAREKELALRVALGAGRWRIVAQVLTESLMLSLVGGATGVGIAYLGLPALLSLSAGSIPRAADVAIDHHVLLFA